jgi:hypothetical protein
MSDDLITWLRAQLDDDERVATDRARLAGDVWTAVEVAPGRWEVVGAGGRGTVAQGLPQWEAEHIARHDPARVLRRVAADRRILDLHEGDHECSTIRRGVDYEGVPYEEIDNCTWVLDGDCSTVRLMALPHAARPGYREEWRP